MSMIADGLQPGVTDHVVVQGIPGSGKTTLAVEVAHSPDVRKAFPDGVLWASLGKRGQGIVPSLGNWARALGVQQSDLPMNRYDEWSDALHSVIGTRQMLLVVDDVWERQHALPFLIGGPEAARLVTTRSPATAQGLTEREVVRLDELAEGPALELLRHTVGAAAVDHCGTRLEGVVEAAAGLPLSLVIAGSYLRKQAVGVDPERMDAALDLILDRSALRRLDGPPYALDRRDVPRSLTAMFELSREDLTERAQSLLRALALLPPRPNSFSRELAQTLGDGPAPLWELCDAGLAESEGVDSRFSLHQSVADCASDQEVSPDLQSRLIRYFLNLARDSAEDVNAMQADLVNQLAAIDLAADRGDYAEYVTGLLPVAGLVEDRLPVVDAERYLRRGLRLAQRLGDKEAQSALLLHLSDLAHATDGAWSAANYARDGLAIATEVGRIDHRIDHMLRLGDALHLQGSVVEARETLSDAYEVAVQERDLNRTGQAAFRIAGAAHTAGDEEVAAVRGEEALRIGGETGDRALQAQVSHILGWVHFVRAEYIAAEQAFVRQAEFAQQQESRRGFISATDGLGWLRYIRGELAESREAYAAGLHEALELDALHASPLASNLGVVETALGSFAEAQEHFDLAVIRSERFRQGQYLCLAWLHSGELAVAEARYDEAAQRLQRALEIAEANGYTDFAQQCHRERAAIAVARSDFGSATELTATLKDVRHASSNRFELVQVLRIAGAAQAGLGDIDAAVADVEASIELARAEGFTAQEGLGLLQLARIRLGVGGRERARDAAAAAAAVLATAGHFLAGEALSLAE